MDNTDEAAVLLRDITSGDAQKIWASSGGIIHLRNHSALEMLAAHLPEIREKTQGVPLGGALFPNSEHLRFALRKLEYVRSNSGCLCHLYPEYLMYNPKTEEQEGNVRIVSVHYLEGGWVDTYTCECTICRTVFRVEERESHYMWWGWKIVEEGV